MAVNTFIGSGNWSLAVNWSLGHKPLAGEDIVFNMSSGNCAIDEATATIANLDMTGYIGSITGSQTVYHQNASASTIILSGNWSGYTGALYLYATAEGGITDLWSNAVGVRSLLARGVGSGKVRLRDNYTGPAHINAAVIVYSGAGPLDLNGFTLAGANGTTNKLWLYSEITGTQRYVLYNGGSINNADVMDIRFTSAADIDFSATNVGDCGNNSITGGGTLTFPTPTTQYWAGITGNYSDVNCWHNMVDNFGFETYTGTPDNGVTDAFTTWTVNAGTGVIEATATAHSGSIAAKLTSGSSSNSMLNFNVYAQVAGTSMTFSVWTRGDGTNAGRYALYDVTNGAYVVAIKETGVAGTTYTQVTETITVPANCVRIRIDLYCPSAVGGVSYFDDVVYGTTSTLSARVPLPQDNVVFGAFTGAGKVVTFDIRRLGASIDCSGVTNSPTIGTSVVSSSFYVYGSLTLAAGMTWNSTNFSPIFAGRGATFSITMAGKTWVNNVSISAYGGTYAMQDAMSISGALMITSGTLDTGIYTLTYSQLLCQSTTYVSALNGSGSQVNTASTATAMSITGSLFTWNHTGPLTFSYTGAADRTYNFGTSRAIANDITITPGGGGICYLQCTTSITFTGQVTCNGQKALKFSSDFTYLFSKPPLFQGGVPNAAIVGGATLNGNLDTAGTGGFADWIEGVTGTSTVNRDTSNKYEGTSCCRFDIDASNSATNLRLPGVLTIGTRYKLTYWAKVSDATGAPLLRVDSGGTSYGNLVLTTNWTKYTLWFTALNTDFYFRSFTNCASKSIYIDAMTLEPSNAIELVSTTAGRPAIFSCYGTGSKKHTQVKYAAILDIQVSNLVANPGFETAGAGGADVFSAWYEVNSNGAIAQDTGVYCGGLASVKLTDGSTDNTYVRATFGVLPGKTYTFSFWTRGDGANAGRYSVYDVSNAINIVALTSTGVTGTTWTQVTFNLTAPAGCYIIQFNPRSPAPNDSYAYFDDVSVTLLEIDYWWYDSTCLWVSGTGWHAGSVKVFGTSAGNWSDATKWIGGLTPITGDDVFFESDSGNCAYENASVLYFHSLVMTGYIGTFSGSSSYALRVRASDVANVKLAGTITATSQLQLYTTGAGVINLYQASAQAFRTIQVLGAVDLQSNIVMLNDALAAVDIQSGSVNMNGYSISGYSPASRVLIYNSALGTSASIINVLDTSFANADFQDIACTPATPNVSLNFSAIAGFSGDCGGNSIVGSGTLTFTPSATQTFWGSYSGSWSNIKCWNNRICNGDFEAALTTGWTLTQLNGGTVTDETSIVHSGGHAIKVTMGTSGDTRCSGNFVCAPGDTVNVVFWTRGDGTNAGRYRFYDLTNGAWVGTDKISTGISGTTYTQVVTTVVAPAGCYAMSIGFWGPPGNTQYAYYDDIQIYVNTSELNGRVPLPQDDVVITTALSTNICTVDIPRIGRSISFLAACKLTTSMVHSWYGSLDLTNAGALTINGAHTLQFCGRGAYLLTSAGRTIGSGITLNAPGGSLTAQDATITGRSIFAQYGTFSHGIYSVSCDGFGHSGSGVAEINGSGSWSMQRNSTSYLAYMIGTNFTWNDTGTLNFLYAGALQSNMRLDGITTLPNDVNVAGGGIRYFQSGHYLRTSGTVIFNGPATVQLESGGYYIVDKPWVLNSSEGSVIATSVNVPGIAAKLYYTAGGNLLYDWLVLRDWQVSELVHNGDFEDTYSAFAPGWLAGGTAGGSAVADTVTPHVGVNALKLTKGTQTIYVRPATSYEYHVIPGRSYSFSFWTKGDGTNAGRYELVDQTHTVDIIPTISTGVAGTTWTQVSTTFTAPANCYAVQIWLYTANVVGAVAYFDDVSIKLQTVDNWYAGPNSVKSDGSPITPGWMGWFVGPFTYTRLASANIGSSATSIRKYSALRNAAAAIASSAVASRRLTARRNAMAAIASNATSARVLLARLRAAASIGTSSSATRRLLAMLSPIASISASHSAERRLRALRSPTAVIGTEASGILSYIQAVGRYLVVRFNRILGRGIGP